MRITLILARKNLIEMNKNNWKIHLKEEKKIASFISLSFLLPVKKFEINSH